MENNYVDNYVDSRTPEERANEPDSTTSYATRTYCTCKIDNRGKLTIDKACYWHGK